MREYKLVPVTWRDNLKADLKVIVEELNNLHLPRIKAKDALWPLLTGSLSAYGASNHYSVLDSTDFVVYELLECALIGGIGLGLRYGTVNFYNKFPWKAMGASFVSTHLTTLYLMHINAP